MKVVILAGGLGSRISEESIFKPKPLIEIGGLPILTHIMRIYSHYGFNDFIICCGYKGTLIKEYFLNYRNYCSDFTINLSNNSITYHNDFFSNLKVTLIDTGLNTMTGGRLKRLSHLLSQEDIFFMTYGDGLSNINLLELLEFHKTTDALCTLTAVIPPARFGSLKIKNNKVISFKEKLVGDIGFINGGFFVLSPKVLDFITSDNSVFESDTLEILSSINQLSCYKHQGFWHPMDTMRDKNYLESLWDSGDAPWKLIS